MISRRSFVASSSVALLTPYFATSKGYSGSANDRLQIGVIGVGTMGGYHLQALLGRDEVEVIAVSDVVRERRENGINKIKERAEQKSKGSGSTAAKEYLDFRELIDAPGLDAVLIATPDHWHTIPCILAARAGKHIYCEKPLTHNIAEGRRLVSEVAKAGVIFQTGSQQRSEFGGNFRNAVEAIWNGRIGDIKRIRIGVGGPAVADDLPDQECPEGTDFDRWLGPAPKRGYNEVLCPKGVHGHFPAWRNYREYAGGQIADMGAHHFDIAQWAMKMDHSGPVEIIPPSEPNKTSGLIYRYANGVEMIHNEFEGIRADCVFEGTKGTLWVSRDKLGADPESILSTPLPENAERVMDSNNHHGNWLNGIRSGKSCICTAEIGHRSATICHLGNIGYRLGRRLKWNPTTEQFENDPEANRLLAREDRTEYRI